MSKSERVPITSPPLRTSCTSPAVFVIVPAFFSYAAAAGRTMSASFAVSVQESVLNDQKIKLAETICPWQTRRKVFTGFAPTT